MAHLDVLDVATRDPAGRQHRLHVGRLRDPQHDAVALLDHLRRELRRQRPAQLQRQLHAGDARQQVARGFHRDDPARLQHRDARAHLLRLLQVVRGQDDRVAILVQTPDELPQPLPQFHIHAGGRLVQHDHRGAVYQRLRHQHAALHAARQRAHVGIGLGTQVQVGDHLVDPGVVVPQSEIAGLDPQRLAYREERIEHQLLGNHSEAAARQAIVARHVMAHHGHAARAGPGQPGHDRDQRRLARPVGAEQTEELALLDPQADAIERRHARIALDDMARFDCRDGHEISASTPYSVARLHRLAGVPCSSRCRPRACAARCQASSSATADESDRFTLDRSKRQSPPWIADSPA